MNTSCHVHKYIIVHCQANELNELMGKVLLQRIQFGTFFFNVGPPKEDNFSDHLLWSM